MTDEQIVVLKRKSAARKRELRRLNKIVESYRYMVDASLSDAARCKMEADMWKKKYEECNG